MSARTGQQEIWRQATRCNWDTPPVLGAVHASDAPLIPEIDLSVTVQELAKVGKFTEAAMAIEIAVRRAYQVEAAK